MRIFLTGGHGFIGSRVVRLLLARGHQVRCLVREKSNTKRIEGLGVERVLGDVRNQLSLETGMAGTDACIHLASVSSWADLNSGAVEATIIDGTKHLLEAAKKAGVKRVVDVSSSLAVNGTTEPRVHDETSAFELDHLPLRYSHAKRRAEELCRQAATEGLEVVTVNPVEVYGREDDAFITAGNLKDTLSSWPALACRGGTGVAHVDDVAEGVVLALEKGRSGERYILGGDNLHVEEIVRLTLEIAGKKTPVLRLPNGLVKGMVQGLAKLGLPTPVEPAVLDYATLYWFMDCTKARRELGYKSRPARECLEPVVQWLYEVGHVKGTPPAVTAGAQSPG